MIEVIEPYTAHPYRLSRQWTKRLVLRVRLRQQGKKRRRGRTRRINYFDNDRLRRVGGISENNVDVVIVFRARQLDRSCGFVDSELFWKGAIVR